MEITIVSKLKINPNQAKLLDVLMRKYCSCMRYAYNRLKEGKTRVEIKTPLQKNFGINARYVEAAIREAENYIKQYPDKNIVFGGKSLLQKLTQYAKTNYEKYLKLKQIWKDRRTGKVKCIGERAKKGNLNLRILKQGDKWFLRINVGHKQWIKVEFKPKHKYWYLVEEAINKGDPYTVLVKRINGKYFMHVTVNYEKEKEIGFDKGAIGIDLNPECIAMVEIKKDGNLIDKKVIKIKELLYQRKNKRQYLIYQIAKEIVEWAKNKGKGIVIEKLKLPIATKENTTKFFRRRKFRRLLNNFARKKLIEAIISRANKEGIEVKEVNPAYTSRLGLLKYSVIYNLNSHLSAAFVIARRGLGFKEKINKVLKAFITRHTGRVGESPRKESTNSTQRIERWVNTVWRAMKVAGLTAHPSEFMLALRKIYSQGVRWVAGETPASYCYTLGVAGAKFVPAGRGE